MKNYHVLEDGDEVRLVRRKKLVRWVFYHPVKSTKAFLEGMKKGYRKRTPHL